MQLRSVLSKGSLLRKPSLVGIQQRSFSVGVVDFRSDTVTKPCQKMRDAIATCEVGDDIYKDDPTIKKLEQKVADLLGKEASLFVCSGSQANCVAMMTLAQQKGTSVIMGHKSHILYYERGGVAGMAGVMPWVIKNNPDGTIPMEPIEYATSMPNDEHIVPITGISLESSAMNVGGRVIQLDYIEKVKKLAKKKKIKMHLDGARSWNSAVQLNMEMKDMVKDFDIVNVCLSKGMGCPIGSVVAGTEADIQQARVFRKMLGGGMRQMGVVAAPALVALEDWQEKIAVDNENAAFLAHELAEIPGIKIDPSLVETNIVLFEIEKSMWKKLRTDHRKFSARLRDEEQILSNPGFSNENIRFVTHRDVSRKQCEHAVKVVKRLMSGQ